ncbi:MAG TPA: restriction endonuclease subunit S [Fimbriimonas sp.]|nr:restriction endonuclease subunit S [Fimbriimonas sp.]
MSDLPNGWFEVTLQDIVEVNPRKSVDLESSDLVTFIPMAAINEVTGKIDRRTISTLDEVNRGFTQFAENDVLFAKITPSMENGKSAIATGLSNGIGFGSTEFHVLRSKGAVLPEFLWRYVRQRDFRIKAQQVMTGAVGQQRVPAEYLKSCSLWLPPYLQQARIVKKLDSLASRTMRASKELGFIPELIEQYREAILAQAFLGRLSDEWRSTRNIPSAEESDLVNRVHQSRKSILSKNGKSAISRNRNRPTLQSELPKLPRSWAWMTFADCSWELTVGHVGSMKDRYVDKGIPLLRSMNVKPNRIDLNNVVYIDEAFHSELKKSELRGGDLVVVRTGNPGTAAVIPDDLGIANCSDLVIARLTPMINPHFAAFYMNSQFAKSAVREMQVGIAQQHFNVGAMRQMPIPVPSIEEQNEIVLRINTMIEWLDRINACRLDARNLLPQLDEAILAKAFRGELVPQPQDDEPAEILVERSKSEWEARAINSLRQKSELKKSREKHMESEKLLKEVLREAGGWISAQTAFKNCGYGDSSRTEEVENFYAQLRELDLAGSLDVEVVNDSKGRKIYDRIRMRGL